MAGLRHFSDSHTHTVRLSPSVIRSYEVQRVLQLHDVGNARTIQFTPDGSALVCCTHSHLATICAYNGETRSLLLVPGHRTNPASARVLHNDGATQAVVAARNNVLSVDLSRGDWLRKYTGHQTQVSSIAAEPPGPMRNRGGFASSDDRYNIFIWDRRQVQPAQKFRSGRSPRLAYDPLGIVLFAATSNQVLAYDPRHPGFPFLQFKIESKQSNPPTSFEVSPDGKTIALSFADPKNPLIWLHDAHNGAVLKALERQNNHSEDDASYPYRVAFSPEASLLAASYSSASLNFWDVEKGNEVFQTPPATHCQPLVDVAFNPYLAQLASVSCRSEVALWMPNINRLDNS